MPPVDERSAPLDGSEELVDESALSDSRRADEREELGGALLLDAFERPDEHVELAVTADERRRAVLAHIDAEPRAGLDHLPDWHRLHLPFRLDGWGLEIVDDVQRRAVGRLTDEDPVDRRGALHARGRVDDVARGHPLSRLRARAQRHQGLAGRDRDSQLQLLLLLLTHPVADRQRCADGSFGVVLMRDGRTEQCHHGVADELLDRAAEPLELRA